MATSKQRFVVLHAFVHPDADSLALVEAAGGMSQLTDSQRAAVTLVERVVGDVVPAHELPAVSLPWLVEHGIVRPQAGKVEG
jgi:hypothetical protein